MVIEVANTTLAYDSGVKMRAYERGGVKEYWVVDVYRKAMNIYKLPPQEHNYLAETHMDGAVAPEAFSEVRVVIQDIF